MHGPSYKSTECVFPSSISGWVYSFYEADQGGGPS